MYDYLIPSPCKESLKNIGKQSSILDWAFVLEISQKRDDLELLISIIRFCFLTFNLSSLFGRDFFCLFQSFLSFFFDVLGMPVLGIKSSKTTPCLNIYILMQVYAIMLICIEWRLQLSCPLRLYSWKIKIFWHLCLHFFINLKRRWNVLWETQQKEKYFLKHL